LGRGLRRRGGDIVRFCLLLLLFFLGILVFLFLLSVVFFLVVVVVVVKGQCVALRSVKSFPGSTFFVKVRYRYLSGFSTVPVCVMLCTGNAGCVAPIGSIDFVTINRMFPLFPLLIIGSR
jgi:hypothetical protein